MFFGYIRRAVKNAILSGINDAVDVLEQDQDGAHEDVSQTLQLRLRLVPAPAALPGGDEEEAPAAGRRKKA